MLEGSILSRPVYDVLEIRPGRLHLMVADAEGAEAILDLAASAASDFFARAHVIYIPKRAGDKFVAKLEQLAPAQLYVGPSYEAALPRLRRVLAGAHMGLQVYLAGTEGLVGQAMFEATEAGIPHSAIQKEHRGSTARRVQCVHCKGITEDVTHDPFQCAHCGLHLFVRDHYSRRIAAFQGVRVDAEDPGNIPESVERFR
ncbi:hypothetical protein EN836_32345 [Mesorhizobium sp. M1C.F.Ca.ET.193.01.1.1]|uniref:dimethylamine monooxygenase subunit DmmA family protein n=1 Tax=unclassified Mesorhizobium TaxID=325217 RepID=UPI000FD25CA0|nr:MULTISPECIES: dimethylamine monooxygenase subunit DmmA family protein [unclassified Mesorhizobium]TGS91354.1 hypothetical protein EN820_52950 [bacterium M00.F.Ca.ET.177.01.1.1]TGQ49739.1 hypothetical protein EN853_32340 [Mesorhizobium sp. M1C.F.Ca.ET.210.01.1.1]TGQ63987.1 hypothetical protein EN855_032290 [Mesorhizobium sp. M1C.F.Ca.ET.212.01.1.1]TGQ97876.1 hypothetical protein EN847_32160 [Mesorhizobium sp. M1C.F.Ca.ET.204.01.1.1]TGR17917.1 hypothetical protein EN839_32275 [Mesorhizobium s